jgi:isoleucyl-tRNA synthetase
MRDCVVAKFPIVSFGSNQKINELYENVKLLVFCTEPWKLLGTQAIAINEKILYALVKCTYKYPEPHSEYLILAEKRIGEFLARGNQYITPNGSK